MQKPKWILFDLDNTLVDFRDASKRSMKRTFEDYGLEFSKEKYADYSIVNAKVWHQFENKEIDAIRLRSLRFELYFEQAGIKDIDPFEFNHGYLMHLIDETIIEDEVLSLIKKLHGQCRMSIVTNGLKEVQRPRIERVGLTHYFDSIVVSDEIGSAKPQKEYFDYTFNTISNIPDKEHILMVGDSLNSDILGGNNYGLKTCWINPEGKKAEKTIPDIAINHVRELLDIYDF